MAMRPRETTPRPRYWLMVIESTIWLELRNKRLKGTGIFRRDAVQLTFGRPGNIVVSFYAGSPLELPDNAIRSLNFFPDLEIG
jgi:hypothetical protein